MKSRYLVAGATAALITAAILCILVFGVGLFNAAIGWCLGALVIFSAVACVISLVREDHPWIAAGILFLLDLPLGLFVEINLALQGHM